MSAQCVAQLLRHLPKSDDPRLLVGPSSLDDAGVYQLADDLTLVQTVDVFPPIVDEPYDYGRIVAANCLSDAYAMGARPLTVLNVVGFPRELDMSLLGEILRGGGDVICEAGAVIMGGHSMYDDEIKYGLAVTALADRRKLMTNALAQPGDALVLTKPIGTGVISTAIRAQKVSRDVAAQAVGHMARLNKYAAEVMQRVGVHACTDVTGFGLLGHAAEMAHGSGVTLRVRAESVPLMDGAMAFVKLELLPAGSISNRDDALEWTLRDERLNPWLFDVLVDAQTSGGLLAPVAPDKVDQLVAELKACGDEPSTVIGEVIERKGQYNIDLVP